MFLQTGEEQRGLAVMVLVIDIGAFLRKYLYYVQVAPMRRIMKGGTSPGVRILYICLLAGKQ